jgi:hypothetical protein
MTVRVELFESLGEVAGWREREIAVSATTQAGDLFDQIFAGSQISREGVSVLVGLDYVDFGHVLLDGEKVSFLVERR